MRSPQDENWHANRKLRSAKLRFLISSKRHAIQPDLAMIESCRHFKEFTAKPRRQIPWIVDNPSTYCRQTGSGLLHLFAPVARGAGSVEGIAASEV